MSANPLRPVSPPLPVISTSDVSTRLPGSPTFPKERPDSHESLSPPQTFFQKIWTGIKGIWNLICRYTLLGRFFKPSADSLPIDNKRDEPVAGVPTDPSIPVALEKAQKDTLNQIYRDETSKGSKESGVQRSSSAQANDSLDEIEDKGLEWLNASPLNDRNPLVGKVCIYRRTTGKVGADQEYQFSVNLQLWDGKSLQLSPEDLYYPVQVEYRDNATGKKSFSYFVFPSSLFSQARVQQNRVGFVYQKQSFVLQMVPFYSFREGKVKAVPFSECEKTLQKCRKFSTLDFLYERDVLPEYREWKSTALPQIYLSPQTQLIQIGEEGTIPLDFRKLKKIPSHLPRTTFLGAGTYKKSRIKERGFIYYFAACGRPKITILLDQNRLYIHQKDVHTRSELKKPGWKLVPGSQGFMDNFICFAIPVSSHKILRCKITAQLNDRGVLKIKIPRVPKDHQLDTCFAHFG